MLIGFNLNINICTRKIKCCNLNKIINAIITTLLNGISLTLQLVIIRLHLE